MTVKTRDMPAEPKAADEQPRAQAPARPPSLVIPGLMALLFGIPLWLVGARYTLDGWVLGLNLVFETAGLPIHIDEVTGFWSLLLFPIGLGYSMVETRYRPRNLRQIMPFILWALIIATDLGSTYLAVVTPGPDAWAITKWVARNEVPAGIWSTILTFLPDQLILLAIRCLLR